MGHAREIAALATNVAGGGLETGHFTGSVAHDLAITHAIARHATAGAGLQEAVAGAHAVEVAIFAALELA